MNIVKKNVKGKEYFYLEHSYREKEDVKKESLYLGKKIPRNIEDLKKELMLKVNKNKWHNSLNQIKKNYNQLLNSLPKTAKLKLASNFSTKFTYNTNRIEGNTLSLKDTARLLEDGILPKNKSMRDVQEINAHQEVFKQILSEKQDLSLKLVLSWHKSLLETTDKEIAGKIRNHEVAISGSKFEPPRSDEVSYLLRKFFMWYNNNKKSIHPVELAVLAHLKFVTIHPFTDGNGRISRLIMNFILHKNEFPLLDIEYKNRAQYYNSLERSQIKMDDSPFLNFAIKKYLKEYKKYLKK